MSSLPPALNFADAEVEICKKWKEENSFHQQNKLAEERGDEVSCVASRRKFGCSSMSLFPLNRSRYPSRKKQSLLCSSGSNAVCWKLTVSPCKCFFFFFILFYSCCSCHYKHNHTLLLLLLLLILGICLFRWPSFCHGIASLRAHPRGDHQGHRDSLRRHDGQAGQPPGRMGLPRTARRARNRQDAQHQIP